MKVVCYKCKKEFCLEQNNLEGYETVAKCPNCNTINSCR